MNRRSFLLLAAAACGPAQTRKRSAARTDSNYVLPGPDDWAPKQASQLWPSPLVVRGEQIAWAKQQQLAFIDAAKLAYVDYISDRYTAIAALPNGTLLALASPETGPCELDVIADRHVLRSFSRSCQTGLAWLVPAGASTVYLGGGDELTPYRLEQDLVPLGDPIRIDERALDQRQLLGLADGRLLATARKQLLAYAPGAPVASLATERSPAHVALGSHGRIWYSMWGREGIRRVALARLGASELTTEIDINVEPARIIHVASNAIGELAVLTSDTPDRPSWTLRILDDNGRERWRKDLGDEIVNKVGFDLNRAFVAVTETRVVVAAADTLYGWNAADGTRIK